MSRVKRKIITKAVLQELLEKCERGMIVQGWKRSPETSVNKLLFAGSRISVGPSGAVSV
jgi:hypothetical protein